MRFGGRGMRIFEQLSRVAIGCTAPSLCSRIRRGSHGVGVGVFSSFLGWRLERGGRWKREKETWGRGMGVEWGVSRSSGHLRLKVLVLVSWVISA